ncbi:hypothetical protein ACWXWU_19000 [Shewanella sp. A14]
MDEISATQWDNTLLNTDALGDIKYFIFLDIQTLQGNANTMGDYTLALQVVAQRIELYGYGVIEAKRNEHNNAWLAKCITSIT